MTASYLPPRPRRAPAVTFNRPSDGALVEVWATSHTLRSRDRVINKLPYFRGLAAVDGCMMTHLPSRHATPEAAVNAVLALFPQHVTTVRSTTVNDDDSTCITERTVEGRVTMTDNPALPLRVTSDC